MIRAFERKCEIVHDERYAAPDLFGLNRRWRRQRANRDLLFAFFGDTSNIRDEAKIVYVLLFAIFVNFDLVASQISNDLAARVGNRNIDLDSTRSLSSRHRFSSVGVGEGFASWAKPGTETYRIREKTNAILFI